ncbi:MAG: hypothetical protein Q4C91_18765 [Eubacteriales bacterium]|nr:hypothetical protein [Eubacteriales bacterium]
MTKLKNTKKGMAKKALSISLVAAMLATSNVPVWAAEFSDGSEALFSSEAPVTEVEDASTVESYAAGDNTSDMKFDNLTVATNTVDVNSKSVTLKGYIVKPDGDNLQNFNYEFKIGDTVVGSGNINNTDGNVNETVSLNNLTADNIAQGVDLRVYRGDSFVFDYTYKNILTVISSDNEDYIATNTIATPSYVKTGERLTYTGEFTTKYGTAYTIAWYDQNGNPVKAGSEGFYYATANGTYTLKITVTPAGKDAFTIEKTTIAATEIPSESITGSVTISNTAQNQWGYKAKAEYNAQLPENVYLTYKWQTQNEDGTWTTVSTSNATQNLTAEYLMTKNDCGKNLRVLVEFTNMATGEVIISKESGSFEVAPLQISADDITYGNDANFNIKNVNDEPKVDWVKVYKKDVLATTPLVKGEYELVTQDTNRPGIRTVTIKLKGIYAGELTQTVNVGEYDLEDCKVTLENYYVPFVGDGKYAEPVIKEVVWANRVTLVEGEDYVVNEASLKACVDAGEHELILDGRGDFTGTHAKVKFEIVARSMENCKVVWTGKPVIKGEKLVAGVDVKDSENTHFVVVDDKGYILIPEKDYTYDKEGLWEVSQQKCKVVVEALSSVKEDKTNNVYRGGNYYGKAESDYTTVGTNLEVYLTEYVKSVVSAQDYTGKAITFDKLTKISAADVAKAANVSIDKVGFSDDLEVGVDFDITYKNNVDAYLLKDANGNLLSGTKNEEIDGAVHYSQNLTDSDVQNDDPQAPQVYLTFKGKFSGETTPVRFAINQRNLNESTTKNTVIFTPTATDANAMTAYASQVEALQFKDLKGNILKNTVDYTYDYYYVNDTKDVTTENGSFKLEMAAHTSNVMFGNTRVTVYDGNYYGTKLHEATIDAKSLTSSDITVENIANQKYTGKLIEPKVTVKDGSYTLVEGTDYELTYKNNRSAGTATVTIKGLTAKGRYTDNVSKTFVIENKSIEDAKFLKKGAYVSSYTDLNSYKESDYVLTSSLYDNGRAVKAEFDVVDANNNLLREGYDYTVAYKNNTEVGTATIIITGKGDYEGTLEGTFEILGKGISGHFVEKSIPAQTYTGEEIKPEVTFVPDTPNLVLGRDYEIIYEYNIEPGKCENADDVDDKGPKVVAHGIGQYAGYVKIGFEIKKADINVANVTAKDAVYAGGKVAEAEITVTNPASGKALIEGTDYSVEYVSGKEVGDTGKAVLTLKNNKCYTFSGDESNNATITVTYNIVAKDLKDVTVETIADQTVTGEQIKPVLTVKNDDVVMKEGIDYQVTYGENKAAGVGTAVITPVADNKNYTGSKEVTFNIVEAQPEVGKAMITDVVVKGNVASPVLSGRVDGATGYDFVIATEEDYKNGRVDVSKNILTTKTNFYYVQEGTYYAYCHAWKRGEDGKKVFGAWSNLYKFEVTATTPATPKINSVKVSGSTVTVTYTKCADATGYDIVLGTNAKTVRGELRPVNYGTLVKKVTKGNVVTATFKNVPKKTYYAGLHAYNRTSEDGKKVFSKWSNVKKVTVK